MIINKGRRAFYWLLGTWIILVLSAYSLAKPPQKSPYNQIRIPLGMQNGVPFSRDHQGQYSIQGFEIDINGNVYFLGGKNVTLACFTKDGKSIFRKAYPHLVAGEMTIVGGSLFVFETGTESLNTIVEIDKTNGSIIKEYPKTITKALETRGYQQIDYYEFKDSMLRISYIDSEGIDKTKMICFDLHGKLLPDCKEHASAAIAKEDFEHLGKFGDDYVLGKFIDDGKKYLVSLRDPSDKTLSDTSIDTKYLSDPFCGAQACMPPDHRKVRNNKLYFLNRDENMAEITVIDLATFFRK